MQRCRLAQLPRLAFVQSRLMSWNGAREKEFRALTDEEMTHVEALYSDLFADFGGDAV